MDEINSFAKLLVNKLESWTGDDLRIELIEALRVAHARVNDLWE